MLAGEKIAAPQPSASSRLLQVIMCFTGQTPEPVESARAARDAYTATGLCELTYWEFSDYAHLSLVRGR